MPLQQPANYGIGLPDIPDPTEAVRKNLEVATGLIGAQQKNQIFGMQVQQAQQQQAAQQDLHASLAAAAANPTPETIAKLSILHPAIGKELKSGYEMLDENDQKAQLSLASKMHAAMLSNAPDVARQLALDSAAANDNSGNSPRAAQLRGIADQIQNPKLANLSIGSMLASVQGADKYLANFGKFNALGPDQQKTEADARTAVAGATTAEAGADVAAKEKAADLTKKEADAKTAKSGASFANRKNQSELDSADATRTNTYSEITKRGVDASLEQQKFDEQKKKDALEFGKLSPDAEKAATESLASMQKSREIADKSGNLATYYQGVPDGLTSGGALRRLAEHAKSFFGDEDERSAKIREATELINDKTIQTLSGVRMTEMEVAMVKSGFADPMGNPKIFASAMRKIQQMALAKRDIDAATYSWATKNRNMGAATREFTINGRPVKVGDTLDDVLSAMAPKPAAPPAAAAPNAAPGKVMSPNELAFKKARLAAVNKALGM